MWIPSATEMADLDREAQERFRIPGILLMEHAALALREAMEARYGDLAGRPVEVVCGTGNNGGDGFALARLLRRRGVEVRVHQVGDPEKIRGDSAANRAALGPAGLAVLEGVDDLEPGALVVDALLGTGATGAPRGAFAEAIRTLLHHGGPIVSVDVPSGILADGGGPPGCSLRADLTVTMGLPKAFAVCPVAQRNAGEVQVASIGFPPALLLEERGQPRVTGAPRRTRLVVAGVAAGWLDRRPPDAHKGTSGRVLVIAGSRGMSGAAALAARGALRGGAGLVKLLGPPGAARDLGASLPEVMVEERPEAARDMPSERLEELLAWADSVVLGPGLGPDGVAEPWARLLEAFPGAVVVDADSLRLDGGEGTSAGYRVRTPHPGEAARALGEEVGPDLPARRRAACRLRELWGSDVVLKGRFSILEEYHGTWINGSGSPSMATGGSGDVLAGLLGARLAPPGFRQPEEQVALGVYLHGMAGHTLPAGCLASEIADALPAARGRLQRVTTGFDAEGYPAVSVDDPVRLRRGSSTT